MSKKDKKQAPPPPVAPTGRLPSRGMLLLMAFCSGASVMIIELAANRVLAPWFGNSLYTWTGLIGVILVAMSLGYYAGGWLADRRPDPAMLAWLMAAAALFTAAVPLLRNLIGDRFHNAGAVSGPITGALVLFAIPGVLFATVSPFAVRLTSLLSGDRRIGESSGSIGTAGTLGSVIGTFGSGFILIPLMNVETIFFLVAGIMAALALAVYVINFSGRARSAGALALVIGTVVVALAGYLARPATAANIIYEKSTYYHRIRVQEDPVGNGDSIRTLYLDTTTEGAQYILSRDLPVSYQRFWELSRVFTPNLKWAAFLGGGSFGMPEALLDAFPAAQVDVAEIDPEVVATGRQFFRVDNYSPRLNAVAADARQFLARTGNRYDFIFGDAYNGLRYVPAHLLTREFFSLVRDRLTPEGVFMMNLISAQTGDGSRLFAAVRRTLGQVFPHVYAFPSMPDSPELGQNIIIAASLQPLASEPPPGMPIQQEVRLRAMLSHMVETTEDPNAPILTDDYNPVEYIVAQEIIK